MTILSRIQLVLLGVLTLCFSTGAVAQKVDLDSNGMSDVWEALYGNGLDTAEDSDGDGVVNLLESIAGTNPLDPGSNPKLHASQAGTNLIIRLAGALGKRYELQTLPGPDLSSNWVAQQSFVLRSGSEALFTWPLSVNARFFRVAVSDVDSDNDGLNDWEEYQARLDPFSAHSNGQMDDTGELLTDYAYAAAKARYQDVVTISASDAYANQPDASFGAQQVAAVAFTRGGFPCRPLTVSIEPDPPALGGAVEGVDYATLPRTVQIPAGSASQTLTVTPLPNTNRFAPVTATVRLLPQPGYRVGWPSNASVVIAPPTTPSGTGLNAQYFTNASATYSSTANFNPVNLRMSTVDPVINFAWSNNTQPFTNSGYYSIRWSGQVQPQYSETYFFVANTDDGVKLWLNDQLIIDRWILRSAADSVGSIALQAGVRYNIRLEYFNGGGNGAARLYWYSASQPKQIIPANRLYPAAPGSAPSVVTSPLTAIAFLSQPFSYQVTGANSPGGFTASGLPPGLALDATSGLIAGSPNLAGTFQVLLTASNAFGLGASVLELQVLDTGSSVVREVWTNVPGTNITDIPLDAPPSSTSMLGSLEGITDFGDDYGERIRGYFTAPATANFYFWLAASDSAELWLSNDSEPCNKVRRAYVRPGESNPPRAWTAQSSQRSPWLTLTAGQRYYLEILHKAGTGTGDNWSVGWVQDPSGTNLNPAGVVPAFVLSRYFQPPASIVPGTLYTANMAAQGSAVTSGSGSATLRVSADGSRAVLSYQHSVLSSPVTAQHIHCDPYLNHPSQILFDIDQAELQPGGGLVWNIGPVGTLTAADILEIIREGKAFINIHTVNYPAGEINGHFVLADGTQTFTPPPPAPAWADDHATPNAAARFLTQATFGPSPADIAAVQALGYEGWIEDQFTIPPAHHLPQVFENISVSPVTPYPTSLSINAWWQQSLSGPDQLRQRVAFALSEIMVVSGKGVLANNARALSSYYDTLLDHAFGNFRELLEAVTLSPAMGIYLDMRANSKGSIVTGVHPNENYAREILQLFSIGLYRMWPDGSLVMDSGGNVVPTYNQNVIMGFASTFTGWNYYQTNQANGRLPTSFSPSANYTNPMVLVPTRHELGTKLLLDNVMLPQAWGSQTNPASAAFDSYCLQDLEQALDSIFHNQNVGPFICRQLIQRLVTSHPSRDYLYRVVQQFNDNGAGVRGDMKAVIKAILLDPDARSSGVAAQPTFGKQREPLLRATATARAFPPPAPAYGTYLQNGTRTITVSLSNGHRLNNNDTVYLAFTDASGLPEPTSQAYAVTPNGASTFTVNAPGLLTGTYSQRPNITLSNMVTRAMMTTNVIYVSISGHGLAPGNPVYLEFTSGGASGGVYQVVSSTNANSFFVVADSAASLSGNSLLFRLGAGGYVQRGTTATLNFAGPHGLDAGDQVYINFTAGTAPDGVYTVTSVPDAKRFTVTTANSVNQTQNGSNVYPLRAPPLVRTGNVLVRYGTGLMGNTDATLTQTPLYSPTVFNYFLPDYQFPGPLAAAGLTTPEFQLTSDTEVAVQMNFLANGLLGNTGNTNGLSSLVNGGGAVMIDLGPYMNAGYLDPGKLVDSLSSLLTSGQLSPAVRNTIVNYVGASFPHSSPPTATQLRDRARAAVHLIVCSPDFIVQK